MISILFLGINTLKTVYHRFFIINIALFIIFFLQNNYVFSQELSNIKDANLVIEKIGKDYLLNLGILEYEKYPKITKFSSELKKAYIKEDNYHNLLSLHLYTCSEFISKGMYKDAIVECLDFQKLKFKDDIYIIDILNKIIFSEIYFNNLALDKCYDYLLNSITLCDKAIKAECYSIFDYENYKLIKHILHLKLIAICGYSRNIQLWDYYLNIILENIEFLSLNQNAKLILINFQMQDCIIKNKYNKINNLIKEGDRIYPKVNNNKALKSYHSLKSHYYQVISELDNAKAEASKAKNFSVNNNLIALNLMKLNAQTLYKNKEYEAAFNLLDSLLIKKENYINQSKILEIEKYFSEYQIAEAKATNSNLVLKTFVYISISIISITPILLFLLFYIKRKTNHFNKSNKELNNIIDKTHTEISNNSKFLYDMGHELRSPLNSILGFSEILLTDDTLTHKEKLQYSNIISDNSNLLLNTINDIVVRSTENNFSYNFSYVDFISIAKNTIYSLEKTLPYKVKFEFITNQHKLYAKTDPYRLSQVLNNLLSNAYKFTEKGKIILELERKDKLAIFSIKDTGIGVEKNIQDIIFNRNITGDNLCAGTGLGLTISKNIINDLGGEIYLDKEYTEGARFYFTHPIEKL